MTTVETAINLLAMGLVLALGVSTITAVVDQLRCTDAAREAARLIARGEPERAASIVQSAAPPNARLTVHADGDTIRVEVSARPSSGLPGLHLTGRAYAVLEPTSEG
ncbi:TadE family type IV pilus minor pilin [Umezawaea endophytica]|uniref:Pilus assembly protein n=1 Tax=Umezawaea endophytica TaxID=1654476 RepID=A0A9X2VX13_9PSEU|nr:TadE family type IV pilus minor pilin [Umezawaea endophytica]MCS7484235.1 pilus assembly protein [Umezawaea endophytica]